MSVFLDPGHNGANDASMSSQVPDGRGGTKECQTTGTSTSDGYPEHSFNWDVATRVRAALERMGVVTQMSRADDSSVAPCVDQRAAAANAMHPDADVSIHADGGPGSGHGFHVNYSAPPLNAAQSGPAMQLAAAMRDSLGLGRVATVDVRRLGRFVRALRPGRSEPRGVSRRPRRDGQHAQRRRSGCDGNGRGASTLCRRHHGGHRRVPDPEIKKGGFGRTFEVRLISLARSAFTSCRLFGSVTPEPVVRSTVPL